MNQKKRKPGHRMVRRDSPRNMGLHHCFKYSMLASSLTLAFSAWAQTTPENTASDSSAKQAASGGLAEVVITAERRPVTIQKTAASITAVSGEELREKGQATLESVLQDIPAVEMQASPQGGQVFIRGVGANGDSNWVDPSVALMFDNIYSGRAERVFASMYDIDRVEVLRGPQGTLYGRNATGGSINIISNSPSDKLEGVINAQLGSHNLRHLDVALNLPVNDILSIRTAFLSEKRDGYFSNGGGASDLSGARFKALLKPTKGFSLLATIDTMENKGLGVTTVPRAYTAAVPPFVNWPVYPTNFSDPWTVDDVHPADIVDNKFTTYSLQADWDLGWTVMTLIPAHTHSSRYTNTNLITGTAIPPGPQASTWVEDQDTAELRFASAAGSKAKWVVGLFGYKSTNAQTGAPPASLDGQSTFFTYGVTTPSTSKAAFGQITYPLADGLRVTGGLRYSADKKDYIYGVQSTIGPYNSGLLSVTNSYNAVTYKVGLEYDVAPSSMLYGQVSSGYKAGGFSTTATPPLAYSPEKLIAFEIGSKNRFLNNRLQVNAEAYLYRYNNLQAQYQDFGAPSPNPDAPAGSTIFAQNVVNAGTGINKGAEIEARYRFTPNDEFKFAVTYAHARYGNFAVSALSYLNGTAITNTPEWSGSIGYQHEWDMENGAQITLQGSMKISDGYRVTLTQGLPGGDLNSYQGSYHKSNISITYRSAKEDWSISAWARNLENNAQITNALPFGRVMITDPRTFGVNFSHKF